SVEAVSRRLNTNLEALQAAIAERSDLRAQLETRLDAVHKVHGKISEKLAPIVDDSYFDVVMTAEDVGKTGDRLIKTLVNDGLQVMQSIVEIGSPAKMLRARVA